MSRFTPSSQKLPCPICDDTRGKCRQNEDDFYLCMTFADARLGEIQNGYKCIKPNSGRGWSSWKVDNSAEWSESQRYEWEQRRQEKQKQYAHSLAERRQQSLPADDRDNLYRQIFSKLALDSEDRADLERRGFTPEQIELSGFKSVAQWQPLEAKVDPRLPGVKASGEGLLTQPGYLCPVKDVEGRIVGCQLRLRKPENGNRYRWLSSRSHTPQFFPQGCSEGELPLAIHIPQELSKLAIGICEGVGAKPFLASQRLGIPFIGAAGSQHASSPEFFKSSLQQIKQALAEIVREIELDPIKEVYGEAAKEAGLGSCIEKIFGEITLQDRLLGSEQPRSNSTQWLKERLSDSLAKTLSSTSSNYNLLEILSYQLLESQYQIEIIVTPDAGDILNPSVMKRWQRLIALLEGWGWLVRIAWWGQVEKNHPDIDELTDYSQVKYISSVDFLEKAKVKPTGFKPARVKPAEAKLTEVKEPTEVRPTEVRPTEQKKGSSKSYQEKAKEAWRKAKQFTADIKGASQWCEWKIPPSNSSFFGKAGLGRGKTTRLRNWVRTWQEEGKGFICIGYRNTLLLQLCEKLGFYHLHENDTGLMRHDPSSGIALCIDSLWRFKAEEFDGKILILDEVMSVIKHLLHSSTVKGRDNILSLFQEALQRASQVVCLDGMLADWAVKYLQKLAPDKKIIRAENTFSGDKPTVEFLLGTIVEEEVRKNDRSPWLEHLLNNCAIPAVCSDSQVFIESLDNLLTEKGLKTLRIDSKTVPEEYVKEFLKDCNAYIEKHQPDVILYTPSAESGVDISISGYFTAHFGFFFGVLGVDSILQMIGRIRDAKCTKFLWVKEWVAQSEQSHSKSPFARRVGQAIEQLFQQDITDTISGINRDQEIINKLWAIIQSSKDAHFEASNQIQAITNYEKSNLRECVLDALEASGYSIKLCTIEPLKETLKAKEVVKEATETTKRQNCHDIFTAEKINPDFASELSKKFDARWEERVKVIQASYRSRLPGIDETASWTENFIYKIRYDDPDFLNQMELFWLFSHPEEANRMNLERFHRIAQRERTFIGNVRNRTARIRALHTIGFEMFLDLNKEWTEESPEVVQLVERCKDEKIANALGRHPGKQSNIRFLGSLFKMLGLNQSCRKVKAEDGDYRLYRLDDETFSDPDRVNALQCLDRRWGNYIKKEVEILDWEPVLIPQNQCQEEGGHSQQAKSAESHTQQGFDPVPRTPTKSIYNLEPSCPQSDQVESQGESSSVSEVEELSYLLQQADSPESFAVAIEGYRAETIKGAILSQDTAPRRRQMREWWDSWQSLDQQSRGVGDSGGVLASDVEQLAQAFRYCESASDFKIVIEGEDEGDIRSAIALCKNSQMLSNWWRQLGGASDSGESGSVAESAIAEGARVRNRLGFAGIVKSIAGGQKALVQFLGSVLQGQIFEVPLDELALDYGGV